MIVGETMNILITGKNGYIANEIKAVYPSAKLVSVRSAEDFSFLNNVEILIHTSALVHKKEKPEMEQQYIEINTNLTIELAKQAKSAGVKHFIFFSTMAVYGKFEGEIHKESKLNPNTFYGKSKLAAEQALLKMQCSQFNVSIIRPPMVYGKGCPGNYVLLRKLSVKTPIFPKVDNKRSMIFIDNLVLFVRNLIENRMSGIFHPQDPQFVNTTQMVSLIAKEHSKKIYFTKLGALLLSTLIGKAQLYKKVFGNLYYIESLSLYENNDYQKYIMSEAIKSTEKGIK